MSNVVETTQGFYDSANQEIQALVKDPKTRKYFEPEAPAAETLLDISKLAASHQIFGKWVAKKVPVIAGVELAIDQSYNTLDWLLSFNRMTEAHNITGKVMDAARNLQHHIDETYSAMQECPQRAGL